jgi:uncharacterized membrane protein
VTFANPLPLWALVPLIAALGVLSWLAYRRAPILPRRRRVLSALRLITLLLLLVLLMRPLARSADADAARAVVPVLVDTSRSMSIEDAGGMRRIDRVRQLLESELLPALSARFQPEILSFGESVEPSAVQDLTASGRRSDLTAAVEGLRERYRGRAIAGIVLLSDGGETSRGDRPIAEPPAPVFPIGVGSRTIARDSEVLSVTAAEAVLDDSRVDLTVSAVAHGRLSAPLELRLLENGRPLEVRRVTPAADGTPVSELFHVTPGKGAATVYTVEIPAAAGELIPENNTRSVLVQPPSRARRVLLVQGAPGFEHSFLRRAWAGDTGLDVDSVVRKGKNEQGSDTFYIQAAAARSPMLASGYPVKREDLFGYDAIVLANVEGATLTAAQLEATRDFVSKRGGGLLVLGAQSFLRRGLNDTPLEDVLPLDLADRGRGVMPASDTVTRAANRVSLTSAGETHPIMQLSAALEETRKRWEAVPALASIAPLGGPRAGASVLAVTSSPGGTSRALVAVQRFGDGRSMVFTGEAAWRWRMMLPATDRAYETFWRQAVRWIALPATDPVTVRPPTGATPGDVVTWRIAARDASFEPLRDATVDVRITRPDGKVDSIAAAAESGGADGTFVARYRPEDAGVYRATAEVRRPGGAPLSSTAPALVGGSDTEMTDPRLNVSVLQAIAMASAGQMIEAGQSGVLIEQLRAALPAAALLVRRDLWHSGWSFALLVALLAAEWVLRRRWGLR